MVCLQRHACASLVLMHFSWASFCYGSSCPGHGQRMNLIDGISTRGEKTSPLSKACAATGNLNSVLMMYCFVPKSCWGRREERDYSKSGDLTPRSLGRGQFGLDMPWLNGTWNCLRQELGREILSGGFSPSYLCWMGHSHLPGCINCCNEG